MKQRRLNIEAAERFARRSAAERKRDIAEALKVRAHNVKILLRKLPVQIKEEELELRLLKLNNRSTTEQEKKVNELKRMLKIVQREESEIIDRLLPRVPSHSFRSKRGGRKQRKSRKQRKGRKQRKSRKN